MALTISLLQGATDARPKMIRVPWDKLLAELQAHDLRASKDGPAWCPVDFVACPDVCHRAGTKSDCGGAKPHRILENVREVHLAVFDLDDHTAGDLGALGARLEPYTYALHSTFSEHCYRLVIPLAEWVDPLAWGEVWEQIRADLQIRADPACKDASRLYYFPTHNPASTWTPVVCDNVGKSYAATKIQRVASEEKSITDTVTPAHTPPPEKAAEKPEGVEKVPKFLAVDLFEVRKQLRAVRKTESAALIRKVLNGESLQGDDGGYDHNMNRVSSLLATACNPPLEWPTALELLRPSLAATPQNRVGHLEHWIEEMSDQFERARERRTKADAHQAELDAAMQKALGWKEKEALTGENENWKAGLLVSLDAEGELAGLKQVGANANLILDHDPLWKGKVQFNEVTKEIDIGGETFSKFSRNSIDVEVTNWLARSDYRLSLNSKQVAEQLLAVSRRNNYDPLAVWLNSIRLKWDGQQRLESFLEKYFGATGNARYLSQVSKCWMIAAVARALSPGCKVDNVLILQGGQGKFKSTALQVLGGEFFSDTKFDIHDKDGRMMASRFWIIELAELASMRRADVESLKAFFSARKDDIRVPYGRVLETFPRRCVFVGTLNPGEDYLSDQTGNRRFWPVSISSIDIEALINDRNQLWAEAVVRFNAGENWWLEGADIALAEAETASVTAQSARVEPILEWWTKLQHRPKCVTTRQIAQDVLGLLSKECTNGMQQEIGSALRSMGFTRGKDKIGGVAKNVYFAPESMLEMGGPKLGLVKG